jgi:hypothetical protein
MINKDLKFVKETFTKTDGTVASAQVCNNAGVTLISVGKARERVNGNGETKQYYIGNAKFGRVVGGVEVSKQVMVLINGANFDYGVEAGIDYRTRIIAGTGNSPLMIMSHLPLAESITDDFFSDLFDNADITVAVDMQADLVGKKGK